MPLLQGINLRSLLPKEVIGASSAYLTDVKVHPFLKIQTRVFNPWILAKKVLRTCEELLGKYIEIKLLVCFLKNTTRSGENDCSHLFCTPAFRCCHFDRSPNIRGRLRCFLKVKTSLEAHSVAFLRWAKCLVLHEPGLLYNAVPPPHNQSHSQLRKWSLRDRFPSCEWVWRWGGPFYTGAQTPAKLSVPSLHEGHCAHCVFGKVAYGEGGITFLSCY